MNKEGLDYNTQREKLVMPEYGREIQQMVDYCVQLEDRNERQHCAEAIIAIMTVCSLKTGAWRTMSRSFGTISPS